MNAPSPISQVSPDQVLLIAVAAAGPIPTYPSLPAWRSALATAITEATTMLADRRSVLNKALSDAADRRVLRGRLTDMQIEQSSGRALVTYAPSKPGQFTKNGVETARTPHLTDEGTPELVARLKELGQAGVEVKLTIVNRDKEKSPNGHGYRTLVDVEPAD